MAGFPCYNMTDRSYMGIKPLQKIKYKKINCNRNGGEYAKYKKYLHKSI